MNKLLTILNSKLASLSQEVMVKWRLERPEILTEEPEGDSQRISGWARHPSTGDLPAWALTLLGKTALGLHSE